MKHLRIYIVILLFILAGIVALLGSNLISLLIIGIIVGILIEMNFINRYQSINTHDIETTKSVLTETEPALERITVKTGQKIDIVNVNDIILIASNGDYISIYTDRSVFLKEQTMKSMELQLPQTLFLRVHRQFIVNITQIKAIHSYSKSQYLITLNNNEEIKMSQTGYEKLKEKLDL